MGLKATQVRGEKHIVPEEDAKLRHLIDKALRLETKAKEVKEEFDQVKADLIEIARRRRRDGDTTVNLIGLTGAARITFRESYSIKDDADPTPFKTDLGDLFDKFFKKVDGWKAANPLKKFIEDPDKRGHGLENADEIKGRLLEILDKKETKPAVKLAPPEPDEA
jgi:hypothetical protein